VDTRPFLGLPPGWYADELGTSPQRYWDGSRIAREVHSDGGEWVEWWQASDGDFYPPGSHPDALSQSEPVVVPSTLAVAPTKGRRSSAWMIIAAAFVLVASAVGGFVFFGGQSKGNDLTADSPSQLAAIVSTAVNKAGSVHVVTTIEKPDEPTVTYVNDVAGTSGQQVITAGGAQITTLVIGDTAYVKANELALTGLFQQSAADAQKYADKWMSYNSGGQAFQEATDTLTLGSLLHDVTPIVSGGKVSTSMISGKAVVGIQGDLPGGISGTLYVASTSPNLPVEEVSHVSGAVTTTVFSKWGEAVNVSAPTDSVPGIDPGSPAS
jgi:hypothetical protein